MATLYGDVDGDLILRQRGGDQTLEGLDLSNTIFGDATGGLFHLARGGDDTITASGIENLLYGGAAVHFDDLMIEYADVNADGAQDSVVHFDESSSVTLYDVAELSRHDFDFVA